MVKMERKYVECPFPNAKQEAHSSALSEAIEHITYKCPSKPRKCRVYGCTFWGNSKEMQAHQEENLDAHNRLLTERNSELMNLLLSESPYVEIHLQGIQAMWTRHWLIDDFKQNLAFAKSQDKPLMSPIFYKDTLAWRMLMFPSTGEIKLKNLAKRPVFLRIALAFDDVITTIPTPVLLRQGETVGGSFTLSCNLEQASVRVAAVVLHFDVQKKTDPTDSASQLENQPVEEQPVDEQEAEHDSEAITRNDEMNPAAIDMTSIISRFLDKLEREGKMQEIISRAEEVAKDLPRDIGRGGKVGVDTLRTLEVSVRKVFESRIHAPESLGEEVDEIVTSRYMARRQKTQIDLLYSSCADSDNTGLNLREFGNMSSYISGSIIMLLKDVM